MLIDPFDVPEVVLAVAPAMQELLRLRKENTGLRWDKYVPNADLEKLTEDTPFLLVRESDGRWSCRISLGPNFHTSTGGDSAEQAFRRGLRHLETCWQRREAEHLEELGVEEDE